MFPFYPPPAPNQPQVPFDPSNQQYNNTQQFRPPAQSGALSHNIHLQPPVQTGFNPQTASLMLPNQPPPVQMPWMYQTNGINITPTNAPHATQFGLQQQQLHNLNSVLPTQFPLNALVLQQCLQSILSTQNQMAGFAHPTMGNGVSLPADGAKFRDVDRQQGGGLMANCWNVRPEMPMASSQSCWVSSVPDPQQAIQAQNNLLSCASSQSCWVSSVPDPQQAIQAQNNLLSCVFQPPQETENQTKGNNNISHINMGDASHATSPNFKLNHNGSWKGSPSQRRYQKPQSGNMFKGKGNLRQFTGNKDKGPYNGKQKHIQHSKSDRGPQTASRRPLSITYPEQEILQWREARKRNYPTKSKIEKKLGASAADGEAMLRRQQLKTVLAKQAELGVEVAELPPHYLLGPEEKTNERGGPRKVLERKGRFQNKFNKRGGRRGEDNWHEKIANDSAFVKRSPTLLRKLLGAEIKRDKSYLLQVFRFMTLNSFFDQWPEKPPVFPRVTGKDSSGNGIVKDLSSALDDGVLGEIEMDSIVDRGSLVSNGESAGKGDGGHENCEKSEEGEITE